MIFSENDRQRFSERIVAQPGGCWVREAFVDVHGYGRFYVGKTCLKAHRVSYEMFVGEIPHGLMLDHLCRNRACVNPAHLEPVTASVNLLRGIKSYEIRSTCKRGHDIEDESNVYVKPNGNRDCRACIRDRVKRYRRKQRRNRMNTPEVITRLEAEQVFVFGSNAAGMHGGGAARVAFEKFGAVWGEGHGHYGQSYAIDTMSGIGVIGEEVARFLGYAKSHPELTFLVTPIGCGIAGHSPEEIAPFFDSGPANVILPKGFHAVLAERNVQ